MNIISTHIPGVVIIEPRLLKTTEDISSSLFLNGISMRKLEKSNLYKTMKACHPTGSCVDCISSVHLTHRVSWYVV